MALEHARGDRVDLLAVADVARLVLVRVRGRRPREADDVPAAGVEGPAERGADARGGSRDDRDAHRARL